MQPDDLLTEQIDAVDNVETLRKKYHAMDYIMENATLSRSEKVKRISALFPEFNDDGSQDDFLNEFLIEQYYYSRSLGMSVEDSAMTVNLSYYRIKDFLKGLGLSLEMFYSLVIAETRAIPSLKQKLLRQLERRGAVESDLQAITMMLEKIDKKSASDKPVELNVFLTDK